MKKNKIMLFLFLIAFFVIIFALSCYASPNKGVYENKEFEELFQGKSPIGLIYNDYEIHELNDMNDYHWSIVYDKKFVIKDSDGSTSFVEMTEDYLPTANFKVEVYRDGTIKNGKVVSGEKILTEITSDNVVKHLGSIFVDDIIVITNTSTPGSRGNIKESYLDGSVLKVSYSYFTGFGLPQRIGEKESIAVQIKDRGKYRIAMQTKIDNIAVSSDNHTKEFDIWSTNGSQHAWGTQIFGRDDDTSEWSGWSHFTSLTFSAEKSSKDNDMGIEDINLIDVGKIPPTSINEYNIDKIYALELLISHISGKDIIGENDINNPKATINISVKNDKNIEIYNEKIQANKILEPNKTIVLPLSKSFQINSNKIIVHASIDDIHAEKGFNIKNENDIMVKEFMGKKDNVDIGMIAPVKMFRRGIEVNNIELNSPHTFQFSVKHFSGDESVGKDEVYNPKVKINVTYTDIEGNIVEQAVQATEILEKDNIINMPLTKPFMIDTRKIEICATIDKIHNNLGYDSNQNNNTICRTFSYSKNYAVSNFSTTPIVLYLEKNKSSIKQPITFNYTLSNEGLFDNNSISNPIIVIRQNGREIWRDSVSLFGGKSISLSKTLTLELYRGSYDFEIEINPTPRETEYKPGISNPYIDNIAKSSIFIKEYEDCVPCTNLKTSNNWSEIFYTFEQKGTRKRDKIEACTKWKKGECVGKWKLTTDYWCEVNSYKSDSKIIKFNETYGIESILFKSKWSEDNYGGWVNALNQNAKIKAGYGFELEITTRYKTNRINMPSPEPYTITIRAGNSVDGRYDEVCSYATRSPGVTPIDNPNVIYLIMPYKDKNNKNVCYILTATSSSGSWYDNTKTFELPLRNVLGNNERKIYTNETSSGRHYIEIRTPNTFNGYYPDAPYDTSRKKPLQDCVGFYIDIIPQDDLKSHIIQ